MQVLRTHLPDSSAALPGFGWQAAWPLLPLSRAGGGEAVAFRSPSLPAALHASGTYSSGSSAARPGADQQTATAAAPQSRRRLLGRKERVGEDPTVPTGVVLVPQAGVQLGPQSGMTSAFSANPPLTHRMSGTIDAIEPQGTTAQQARPSSAAQLESTWARESSEQHLQSEQQQQQQEVVAVDPQAVRNANAAWTAATWRHISGQQP